MRTTQPLARVTATLLLTALLVIALAFAVLGAFQTRAQIASTFARESTIQRAQIRLEEMLRMQIDEDNFVRGYALTKDRFYAAQYRVAAVALDGKEASIRATLQAQGLVSALRLLDRYRRIQEQWRGEIAAPLLRQPSRSVNAIAMRGKVFADYETRTIASIRSRLLVTENLLARSTQAQLDRTSYVRAFWLLVFGLLAVLFNAYRSRLDRQLEEERTTTETLRKAFLSESVPLPGCEIGTAYLSASRHPAVGGDVFDVYRLSNELALLAIADVSGKGVDAAVLTAFIKFTIRGIALRRRDPGAILAEFNTAFAQTVQNPYFFVSMFVGILDIRTNVLRYASAGHDPVFLRGPRGDVDQLCVTGPILGVMEEPFASIALNLDAGSTLVLATDGLTEARASSGEFLGSAGAMDLIARGSKRAQALADDLVGAVRRMEGNRIRDDLALLVVGIGAGDAGA